MVGSKHYWFKDMRARAGRHREGLYPPLDATIFGMPGAAPVFCFFSSEDYAREWLAHQLSHTLTPNSVWVLHETSEIDYVLAVCDEAADVPGSPREEAFFVPTPFRDFLIDPPLELRQAPLPMNLEQVKEALQSPQED